MRIRATQRVCTAAVKILKSKIAVATMARRTTSADAVFKLMGKNC